MLQDVRHALRLWRRRPSVTVLVVLTLAIGIAATTVVFGLADVILWHPLPFQNGDRLFTVNRVSDQGLQYGMAQDTLERWTGREAVFDFAFRYGTRALQAALDADPVVDIRGEPEVIGIVEVAPGLITALGGPPPFGRDFTDADARDGAERVAIVSDALARRLATGHGDPPTTVTIGGVRYTIVGTMPPGFAFPSRRTAAWLPRPNSRIGSSDVVAQVRRGLSLSQAQQLVDATSASGTGAGRRLRLMPFAAVSPQTATALRVLAGAVALLLLIAIGNAANVLLADAVRRDAEMTLRSSLGASRWRLARQIVAEVLIRSMAAATAAAALSMGTLAILSTSVPQVISFRALRPIALDWRALLFGAAIAAAAGLLAGMTSMARAAGSTHLDSRLRAFGWQTRDHGRIRNALLVIQLALTVAVLAGAGLLGHAFVKLSRVDYGFDPEHLVSFSLKLPARTAAGRGVQSTLDQLRAEASRVPDVVAATISDSLPPRMNVGAAGGLETLDRGRLSNAPPAVSFAVVDEAFFKTVGIQLIGGRVFDERDTSTATGPRRVVVSRSLASRLWPGENAVGREFREDLGEPWLTVIGIVGDVNSGGFDGPLGPLAYYLARGQRETVWPYEQLTVRVRQDPARAIPALRSLIRRVVPDVPIVGAQTAYETIGDVNARVRFITFMMMGFAGIALALALIGVYGAFSCAVEQRRKEIGVRLALGAAPGDVMRMMLRTSARLTLVALGIGLPLAFAATPVLRSFLFDVSPGNPATFAVVTLFLIVTALAATYVPAQRAASVDPMEMLRDE